MTIMEISPPRAPDADSLRRLLQSGPSADAVAQLLPGGGAVHLSVERLHFPRAKPVQAQIRAVWADGKSQTLLGEWVGDRAADIARLEGDRLAKPRRGQATDRPAIVGDPERGLVLRRPGFDAKLPGLRLLHDPLWAAERLSDLGLDPTSGIELVAHRLGKRAVLRISGPSGSHYARLRPVTSTSGRQAYERHLALWEALQSVGGLSIPRPVCFVDDIGLALFDALPGRSPTFQGLEGFRATAAVMKAIAAIQAFNIAAPIHTPEDELALLGDWSDRLESVFPDLAAEMAAPLSKLRDQMSALSPKDGVLCHRDLHEGQVLMRDGQAGLLDFDTLRRGDPALDAGNLQAHLILAGLRDGGSRRAFVTSVDNALPSLPLARIALWRRAALLRLAMIYAFSAERREVIRDLIGEGA
jgi:hypothetical protein